MMETTEQVMTSESLVRPVRRPEGEAGREPTARGRESAARTLAMSAGPGVARRLAARFALVAFGLYHLPLMLNNYPSLGGGGASDHGLAVSWGHVFGQVGLWVARHIFQYTADMPYALSGDNGDTVEEYCRLLVAVVVAIVVSVTWTAADRRRPRARWVEGALHVMLRYSIALGLASYALAKLYPVQFWPLSPSGLDLRVGELDPMGLAWAFMKYSRAYSLIAGILEILVVALLCFRRTALLGALLCVPVMLNVMLMNLCYGVIVKLYATITVVSALVLVLYEARRLADLLVWHRDVPARPIMPPFQSQRLNRARWVIKALVVGSVLWSCVAYMSATAADYDAGERTPLWGMWDVTSIAVDGRELGQTGAPARWRRMTTGLRGISIRFEDDRRVFCLRGGDEAARTLTLTCSETHQEGELHWTREGRSLRLEGMFDRHRVSVSLTLRDTAELPLKRDPFRWTMDG